MSESIIVGLMVGGGVAVIGALIGYFLRRLEMKDQWDREQKRMEALWAEEERRRKSERRRELYERDLRIVTDAMHGLTEAMARCLREKEPELRVGLIAEAREMMLKSIVVVNSLDDPELTERFRQTADAFDAWWHLFFGWDSGKVKEEKKEEELSKLAAQTQQAASNTLRRIREILEEV